MAPLGWHPEGAFVQRGAEVAREVEYLVAVLTFTSAADLTAQLNVLGQQRWEIFKVLDRDSYANQIVCLFRKDA